MKTHEIKALREADTIMAVTAMIECRHAKEQTEREQARLQLQLQFITHILNGVPEAAALSHAKANVVKANGGTVAQQTEFWRAWHLMNRYPAIAAPF